MVAAILGDTANYEIGRIFGNKLITIGGGKLIKKEHLDKTNTFYEKYGGKNNNICKIYSNSSYISTICSWNR